MALSGHKVVHRTRVYFIGLQNRSVLSRVFRPSSLESKMIQPKDSLPGVAILMLDMALASLDRAAEAQTIEDARAAISAAMDQIGPVLILAKKASLPSDGDAASAQDQ